MSQSEIGSVVKNICRVKMEQCLAGIGSLYKRTDIKQFIIMIIIIIVRSVHSGAVKQTMDHWSCDRRFSGNNLPRLVQSAYLV